MLGLDKGNPNLLSFSIVPVLEPLIIKHKIIERIGCGAQPFIDSLYTDGIIESLLHQDVSSI